jgi:hypothetical protein
LRLALRVQLSPADMHREEQEMKSATLEASSEAPKHFLLWLAIWILAVAYLLRALA